MGRASPEKAGNKVNQKAKECGPCNGLIFTAKFCNDKSDFMKVKYIGKYYKVSLIYQKIYEVISVEKEWYRIKDETGEDYLFPPEIFEIVSE